MKNFNVSIVTSVIVLLFIGSHFSKSFSDEIYNKNSQANKLYKLEKYEDAAKLYDEAIIMAPQNGKLKMNKGSALYKMNDLEKAEELYKNALTSDDKKIKADAHYNLGNILYRSGEKLQITGNASGAKEKFQEAFDNYCKAIDNNQYDTDAKWNLQLAHYRLKQAEQQQQQQDKQNKENQDKQVEPSEYAKKIKKQAEELVLQRKYVQAEQLMAGLLQKDKTATSYQPFAQRLKDVNEILK
jgi:tetratricopeptide (TPR) repeat protein